MRGIRLGWAATTVPPTLRLASLAILLLVGIGPATAASTAGCHNGENFGRWLEGVKQEAAGLGVSRATLAEALDGVTFDPSIVARDRRQGVFQQSFLEFSDRMVARYRLETGAQMLRRYADLFARIEHQYGVPGPVIVAFWGLESDFGTNMGKLPILRALATLAYDCRRPEFFRPQLIDALRVAERGDLPPSEMLGDWAGELGHTQFTPSDYFRYAVDYDGDGRRDLIHSVPDAMASTANFLVNLGWRRGEPWTQEVRVPADLAWQEADLAIQHPRSQWAHWGVTSSDGRPLPADNLPASLLLPMGRFGPAFLAYPNFQAYLKWNSALVYSTTAAYFANRLAGASPVTRATRQIARLDGHQLLELQQLLVHQGFKVGDLDGKLGLTTRAAIKEAQLKLGLPADSYPTPELLEKLRVQR
jgi:lytic murein transglycosylase